MNNILMQEEYIEILDEPLDGGKIKRLYLGDSGVFESRFTSIKEVFDYCLKEHGRCTGKIYVGNKNPYHIGWVFEKRTKYTDSNDTYLQEVVVTLHTAPAKRIVEYSPMHIGKE